MKNKIQNLKQLAISALLLSLLISFAAPMDADAFTLMSPRRAYIERSRARFTEDTCEEIDFWVSLKDYVESVSTTCERDMAKNNKLNEYILYNVYEVDITFEESYLELPRYTKRKILKDCEKAAEWACEMEYDTSDETFVEYEKESFLSKYYDIATDSKDAIKVVGTAGEHEYECKSENYDKYVMDCDPVEPATSTTSKTDQKSSSVSKTKNQGSTYSSESTAKNRSSYSTGKSDAKKTSSSEKVSNPYKNYDDGYNAVYYDDDYDWDRYDNDDEYASGVDDALEDED